MARVFISVPGTFKNLLRDRTFLFGLRTTNLPVKHAAFLIICHFTLSTRTNPTNLKIPKEVLSHGSKQLHFFSLFL
jgi:hypothetical protein